MDQGCNGGWQTDAFTYVKKNGQELTQNYAYISGTTMYTEQCKYNPSDVKVHALGYSTVTKDSVP